MARLNDALVATRRRQINLRKRDKAALLCYPIWNKNNLVNCLIAKGAIREVNRNVRVYLGVNFQIKSFYEGRDPPALFVLNWGFSVPLFHWPYLGLGES